MSMLQALRFAAGEMRSPYADMEAVLTETQHVYGLSDLGISKVREALERDFSPATKVTEFLQELLALCTKYGIEQLGSCGCCNGTSFGPKARDNFGEGLDIRDGVAKCSIRTAKGIEDIKVPS